MSREVWKPIVGFEGRYEVSDKGRVRSLKFRGNGGLRVMKGSLNQSGYRVLTLGKSRKQFRAHCLVLEAFVGPRPDGMEGCHGDGDKDNNALRNLRWDTPSGNAADRRSYHGSGNPNSKLDETQRADIKRRRLDGETTVRLAEEFEISTTRVSQIAKAGI